METFDAVLKHQLDWAKNTLVPVDSKGYSESIAFNLFISPMLPDTKKAYISGSGDELGEKSGRGKMLALHSSSALVVNFFEYWIRNHKVRDIAGLCGCDSENVSITFEAKHRIARLGTPHLDLEFIGSDNRPLSIEAKFTEPYQKKTTQRNRTNLDKYLVKLEIWRGLPQCRIIAEKIVAQEGSETEWKYLDTPQLLKHILGLTQKYGSKGFQLLYLWYDYPSHESVDHRVETEKFGELVSREISFANMTYQSLFRKIQRVSGVDQHYVSYLHDRYFPDINLPLS